jgi:hypothetical protein
MRANLVAACVGSACALTASAFGQSINIRFGTAASTPSPAYAAAGLAGAWNTFQVTPVGARQPLVGLQGTPIAAQYYQNGNSSMLTYDNPLTSGDDGRLMDSMLLSSNSPTDGCFWVEGLQLGQYEVTIYAMTPNDPLLQNRTRVDNGTPGPLMVGGSWPGHHQPGITFSRFTVTTNDGVIAFHDGLSGALIQSGMNGVQLEFLPPGGARAIKYGAGCYPYAPLDLSASARPVQGTTIALVTTNIPAAASLSANLLSFTRHDPGIDLAALGMPGCFRYLDPDATVLLSGSGTQSRSLGPIPAGSIWLGVQIFSQSASLVPGANAVGAITSNGTMLVIGAL